MKLECIWVIVVLVIAPSALLAEAAEAPPDADKGFVSIFNGKDLTGWDGDSRLWSVKDGAIRGQTTKENPARGNTFCIYRGGDGKGLMKDFALKLKFRIRNGNSGVQLADPVLAKDRNGLLDPNDPDPAVELIRSDIDVNDNITLADSVLARDRSGARVDCPDCE